MQYLVLWRKAKVSSNRGGAELHMVTRLFVCLFFLKRKKILKHSEQKAWILLTSNTEESIPTELRLVFKYVPKSTIQTQKSFRNVKKKVQEKTLGKMESDFPI